MEIKDLIGLSQPLTKLVEVLAIGTGKLYEPTHIRRIAKAKADELKTIFDALGNNLYLPTKYENGNLVIDNTKTEDLLVRAQNRFLFQEAQKQQNLESVIGKAYSIIEEEVFELKEEYIVSDEPVDKDWILRFFNSVEDISNEQMQEIWAKVLAGEIKQPKSFSLRTLEALKNLSQEEAVLFEKSAKYHFISGKNYFLPSYPEFVTSKLNYDELIVLKEIGFVDISFGLTLKHKAGSEKRSLFMSDNLLAITSSEISNIDVNFPVYIYTAFGKELLKTIKPQVDKNVFFEFVQFIRKNNPKVVITVHEIQDLTTGIYNLKDLLEDYQA